MVYTKKQLAKMLAISIRTVDNWMADGRISYTKVGRKVFFTQDDFDQLVKDNHRDAFFYQQEFEKKFQNFKNRNQILDI